MKRKPTCGLMRPVAFALAILCAALPALADAPEGYTQAFSQDFEDASSYTEQITAGNIVSSVLGKSTAGSSAVSCTIYTEAKGVSSSTPGPHISWETRDGYTTHFMRWAQYGTTQGDFLFNYPVTVTSIDTDYIAEFDYFLSAGYHSSNRYGNPSVLQIKGNDSILATFYVACYSYDTTGYLYKGDSSAEADQIASFPTGGGNSSGNQKAKWLHIKLTGSKDDNKVTLTVTQPDNNNPTIADNVEVSSSFQSVETLYMHSNSRAYGHYISLDNVAVYVPEVEGQPDAPTITFEGDSIYDYKKLVVTAAEGTVDGYSLSYRIGDEGDYTDYSDPVLIESACTIYAKATVNGVDSLEATRDVVACETIPAPTVAITGVDGTSRTVTITSDFDVAVATAEDGTYAASEKTLTTTETTTYYIKAYLDSAVNTGVRLWSAPVSIAVTAGETVQLAAPTAVYLCGLDTIHADWNQSSVVASPIVETIKVTVDGVTTEYAAASTDLIDVSAYGGKTLSVSLAATGYADSPAVTYTVRRPQDEMWRLAKAVDFSALLPTAGTLSFSSSSSADPGTINAGGEAIADWLLTYNIYDSAGRTRFSHAGYRGLGVYNGVTTFTLTGLTEGQLVVVNVSTGSLGDNLTAVDGVSRSQELWGIVGTDGTATFSFGRQNSTTHYLHAVSVYDRRQGLLIIVR